MAALITEAVDAPRPASATGINTATRTVGAVIGAQVGAAILTAATLPGTAVPTSASTSPRSRSPSPPLAVIAVFVTPVRRRRRAELALEPA